MKTLLTLIQAYNDSRAVKLAKLAHHYKLQAELAKEALFEAELYYKHQLKELKSKPTIIYV